MSAGNRLTRCAIAFGVWWATVVGCAAFQSRADRADKDERELVRLTDATNMESIERARAANATAFAQAVMYAIRVGTFERQKLSPALVDEAIRGLEKERWAKPEADAQLLAVEGETQWVAARRDAAMQSVRKSWAVQPTFPAFSLFVRLLAENHRRDEIVELCKQARAAGWLDDRFRVLDICFRSSGATSFEAGLPWASQEDVAYYRAERESEENTQPLGLE